MLRHFQQYSRVTETFLEPWDKLSGPNLLRLHEMSSYSYICSIIALDQVEDDSRWCCLPWWRSTSPTPGRTQETSGNQSRFASPSSLRSWLARWAWGRGGPGSLVPAPHAGDGHGGGPRYLSPHPAWGCRGQGHGQEQGRGDAEFFINMHRLHEVGSLTNTSQSSGAFII